MLDIIIFGGVGDLSLRKLLPSLYYLYRDGELKGQRRILCVSRADMSDNDFLELVREKLSFFLKDDFEEAVFQSFFKILNYLKIDLSQGNDWGKLVGYLDIKTSAEDHNIIYYLSVTPTLFTPICEQISGHKLNPDFSKVVVEKPLGENHQSACEINKILSNSFNEKQIYRIDHYLGKEAVQNILHLRFSNHLMETVWNKDHIERVEITVSETVGVEGRARFLDRTGTLRDMVQNHLMQLLSYITLEAPRSLKADDIRDEKLKVIKALSPITVENVAQRTIRAQYKAGKVEGELVPGYLDEITQQPYEVAGTGETFVALKVNVDNDRWQGVPFYLRTGKRMKSRYAEIRIRFKPPSNNIYQNTDNNQLIIQIQPELTVSINLLMKQLMGTDEALNAHEHQMNLNGDQENKIRIPEAYERLLREVIKGNQTYFVRDDEIMASWKWIDAIREAWAETGLEMQQYEAGGPGLFIE